MKKLLLVSLFSSSLLLFSQNSNHSVISADKMNIMYVGVENPISVAVPDFSCEDLSISVSNGTVYTINRKLGQYVVRPNQRSKTCVVSIYIQDNGEKRKHSSSEFRIKQIPSMEIRPKFNSNELSISEMVSQLFTARIPNFDFPVKFRVSGFSVLCIGDNATQVVYNVKGYKLSTSSINGIKKLRKGDRVVFQDFVIRQKGVNNPVRSNTLFTYIVK